MEALTGSPVDVQKEYEECFRQAYRASQEARQAMLDQQAHDQMIIYMIIAAIIALVVFSFIYRKHIRAALESIFIGAAAKTISAKRDLKNYRSDIAERIREKSEQ